MVVAWLHTHVCRNVPMLQCAWFGGLPFLFSDERRRTDDGRTESSTVNDISSWWNEGIRSILNSILNVKFMLTLDLYLRLPLFSQPTSHRPNTRYRDQSRIKIFTIGVPPSSPSSLFLALSIEYRVSSIEYRVSFRASPSLYSTFDTERSTGTGSQDILKVSLSSQRFISISISIRFDSIRSDSIRSDI